MAHYTLFNTVSEAERTSAYGHSTASDNCLDVGCQGNSDMVGTAL